MTVQCTQCHVCSASSQQYWLVHDQSSVPEAAGLGVTVSNCCIVGDYKTVMWLQSSVAGSGVMDQPAHSRESVHQQAQSDSNSDDGGQQKNGQKSKRERGKGQHKVTKRQKGGGTGSFFADLL